MPKSKSIIHQVKETLNQKLRIGEQKHLAKQQGIASDGIYSWGSYKTYLVNCCAFVKWVKEHYGCKALADARKYVDPYIKLYIDKGYSPYTQKTISNSLAKLYGCSTKDFIPTQARLRANITRSRVGRAKIRFSESRNKQFVDFCKATGLRRHEMNYLKPENLSFDESTGKYMLVNVKGKGGRLRDCPILSKEAIEKIQNTPAGQNVWSRIPANADIHSYRADYCKTVYNLHARPIAEIPIKERYYCRGDLKGVVYDKHAMLIASKALGHNRISIIAANYLYDRGLQ